MANAQPEIVEIREAVASIASPISNAYVDFRAMTASVVAVMSDFERNGDRLIGYGFTSNGRYAQSGLLRERFIPRLLASAPDEYADASRENIDPEKVWSILMANEKPGGHGERSVAVGALDLAIWDLVAKIEGKPLHRVLAERFRDGAASDDSVFVYAAGGYYSPGKDHGALRAEMEGYLAEGYTVVKLKIGGAPLAEDLARVNAVIDVVGDPGCVAVDANGRLDEISARTYADTLRQLGLFWYEEPGDPLDFALLADVAAAYDPPLATGENLFSHQDARNLLRYGGLRSDRDWLQMDPVLSYGIVEYVRMLGVLREHGWSWRRCIPHGGHQPALNMAAGLGLGGNESYPRVFEPFGGFADGIPVERGRVRLPDMPGAGFEAKANLMAVFERLMLGTRQARAVRGGARER
jgi:L-alanine-DL-glutamate epimerase-like enolase superfamily enzyme